jgi:DNA polymerase II large subunit
MVIASPKLQKYFETVEAETMHALEIATKAREKKFDPEEKVDIPIAKNMAERVLGLISTVAPQLQNSNLVHRVMEFEKMYAPLDWRVGFKIAEEVAQEKFCKFSSKKEATEIGIRTGFTYLTGGIVSAPLEGFVGINIKKRKDGKEYVACVYAGPIRGAGGTAAATSVVLTDYVATKMGFAKYDPDEQEVNRIIAEVNDYHERITNLQYFPSEEELRFLLKNLPVEVDGEQTETIEVSNYKDLPRIETNFIRGGVCLVTCEGLSQKAAKLWIRLGQWGKEFGIDWTFLEEFLKIQKKIKAQGAKKEQSSGISPNFTFLKDLVAGRPVLSYPMAYGGFRLRLGRTRTSGFSAIALNSLTLKVLDDFIVFGTQIKIERPGKAGSVTICEALDGPIVLLDSGQVLKIENDNKEVLKRVKKILFLGDILINYGDFSENGHPLVPLGYCEEWWQQEFEKSLTEIYSKDIPLFCSKTGIDDKLVSSILGDIFTTNIDFNSAHKISTELQIALFPKHTYYYSALDKKELQHLFASFSTIRIEYFDDEKSKIKSLIFKYDPLLKAMFEKSGIPHLLTANEFIIVQNDEALSLYYTFGLDKQHQAEKYASLIDQNQAADVLSIINLISPFKIKDKAGTFIGARMGRPEKAKMRKLQGSPQVLFPVGEEGGRLKSFQSSIEQGEITGDFPLYYCKPCKKRTAYKICHSCGQPADKLYFCKPCNKEMYTETCPLHKDEKNLTHKTYTINISEYINSCLQMMNTKVYPDLVKGVKGTSNKEHIPEHLLKGLLRAKHDIYVNKDGTTRYDMSECPITAFKPREIGTSLEKMKMLGYTDDIDGNPLVSDDQVVEIFPQDVILPSFDQAMEEQADDVLLRTGNFVDDLLETLYGKNKYYNFRTKEDTIGTFLICLAPHISCGTMGRVIGYSRNQVMLAHPMMHAALRRDCDGDEACFILLMDAFLNFSRQFLPDKRGTRTMDAPLVLSVIINPSEVDDQVLGLDVVKKYPLELYEAAQQYKMPKEVPVEQLKKRLNTEMQYEHIYFTHPVENINKGPKVSAYKTLPSMDEKLKGQMFLAEKIRAVDSSNVATLVIQKHFLKDIKGNLRKFSTQEFRCLKCNHKYGRPPLIGKCVKCGGKLAFTISEGSIIKYLTPSLDLAKKYNVSPYLRQTLDITKERVDSVFGKEKEVQSGLNAFF